MYDNLDVVQYALNAAEASIMRDRLKYKPFFMIVENFITKKDLILGGRCATLLLIHKPLTCEDFYYDIYSTKAKRHAYELVDACYRHDPAGLGHYAVVMPQGGDYEIFIDQRPLFRVKPLETVSFIPIQRQGNFTRLLLNCLGPEIQLIHIYSQLADPSHASSWSSLLHNEEELYQTLVSGLDAQVTQAAIKFGAAQPFQQFRYKIMKHYLGLEGHALVGQEGLNLIMKQPLNWYGRFQLITSLPFEDELRILTEIATPFGITLQSRITNPRVPVDQQLRRMTIYLPGRKAFIDIFNAGAYQVQTIIKHKIPCASLYAIMRFLLIDAWTLHLVVYLGHSPAADFTNNIYFIYKTFKRARELKNDKKITFPFHFLGSYVDKQTYQKRERFRTKNPTPPYYPASVSNS